MQLRQTEIRIQANQAWLNAFLAFAPDVRGLIIVATPYVQSWRESRLNYCAGFLHGAGFGTLMTCMLTQYEEQRDPDVRYNISLIGTRLQAILTWIDQQPDLQGLPLGILTTHTVSAAAIRLLYRESPSRVSALVSMAGRVDLAGGEPLRRLEIPVLLQVPADIPEISGTSSRAYALLNGIKLWHEFRSASTEFIEPGILESASRQAAQWFMEHLPASDQSLPSLP